ncbi:hypothetical protein [Polynucleobacter sp.]|uniref:hypothetical protein n=1 Tax=Polynucleobacter sp. TaxID=2029855 RepID=UPI003F6A4813
MSVFFDGRELVTPTTASAVNDDAMANRNLTVGNIVAFIGKSTGGKPNEVLRFGNPAQAKEVLRSGELLDAVVAAFDPSAETPAPSTVLALRVNPAVQSTLALKNAATATVITLTSVNYGQADNQIKAKVESGTTVGKRVTVTKGSSSYAGDNLARSALSVLYSGAEASATVTVDATSVVLAAPSGTTVSTILFADFPDVLSLVDKINTVSGFAGTVLDGSDNKATANGLDFVAATDCKTAAYTITANLQAVVDWFNSGAQPLVVATRASAVGSVPANVAYTYLAGGSEGSTTNTEWSGGFTKLQGADLQWLSPISDSASIHAMADAHAAFCSTILRRERRVICGSASATSDAAAIVLAKNINSDRTSLVHLGYYDYNAAGELVLRPPYMTAALIAAAFAGVNPGTPLTNKTLKMKGLERDLLNPTNTDVLIKGGVLCVENTEQGYKVVKSISTWLTNRNYNRVEQSTGCALDFTVRNVRQAVDVLRGQKGNPLLLSRANSLTESTLRELARNEPEGPGVLAGDATNPAYKNISSSLEGDVVRIQFECSPVIPANYVLVTVYAVPFSGSATA